MFKKWSGLCHQKKMRAVLETQYDTLYRVAYGWSQSRHVALDLVQDTMVKALEKSDQLHNFEGADRWLFKIMHNQFLDYLRQNKKWVEMDVLDKEVDLCSTCVEQVYIRHQTCENVHQAIGRLSVEYRQIILLVDLEGHSYQEVSDILQVPIGTVMSRLSRARKHIRQLIERSDANLGASKVVEFKAHGV